MTNPSRVADSSRQRRDGYEERAPFTQIHGAARAQTRTTDVPTQLGLPLAARAERPRRAVPAGRRPGTRVKIP